MPCLAYQCLLPVSLIYFPLPVIYWYCANTAAAAVSATAAAIKQQSASESAKAPDNNVDCRVSRVYFLPAFWFWGVLICVSVWELSWETQKTVELSWQPANEYCTLRQWIRDDIRRWRWRWRRQRKRRPSPLERRCTRRCEWEWNWTGAIKVNTLPMCLLSPKNTMVVLHNASFCIY